MSVINRYLATRYVRGGREWPALDCWGLVRLARAELFGMAMLPLCGDAYPGDMPAITRACQSVAELADLRAGPPCPGAIATAWRARLCVHVGLIVMCDGVLRVLETDLKTGPCLTAIAVFSARYTRVLFYADTHLPESAARFAN